MYSPHKHSYLQSRTQRINPRIINRTVFLARSQPTIDEFDLEPPFLRLTSEQPSIPVQHVDVTRRPVAFGRWALPKLRRELHDPKLSVVIEAITSITDLVHDPEKGYEAITLRIPDRISDLIAHEEPEVRERACMALTVIAGLADGKDAIVKNKATLTNLARLVEDPLDVLRMKAAVLLEMIARSWMAADYLVEAGFVPLLLEYVGKEDDPIAELQLDILRWIMYGEGKDIALKLGAFNIFVDLMENGSKNIISKAALCLMMITSTYSGKRIAYTEKILPRLTNLLLRDEPEIYTGAASAIMFTTINSCAKLRARDIPHLAKRLVTLANDWHNPETQIYCIKIKSAGPKLVPFFKTLAIYFVVYIPQDQPSILATILKCLPVISLVVFVILHTKSAGTEYQFSKRLIAGMLFSVVGDALLIWPGYFDLGVLSFLIGHINYIYALSFKPLNLPLGIACYAVGTVGTLFFLQDVGGILILGLPLYCMVLMTMVWRAAARVQFSENSWSWSKLWTCAGGISFAISDLFVGIYHFKGDFAYAQLIIMPTYYGGQLGLALSVLDAKVETVRDHDHQKNCADEAKAVTDKKQGSCVRSN